MRPTLVTLAVFGTLTLPAFAEPQAAHPQPTPSTVRPSDSAVSRSDELFRRSAQRSEAVMRSICLGCGGPSPALAPKRVSHKPTRVTPTSPDEAE